MSRIMSTVFEESQIALPPPSLSQISFKQWLMASVSPPQSWASLLRLFRAYYFLFTTIDNIVHRLVTNF